MLSPWLTACLIVSARAVSDAQDPVAMPMWEVALRILASVVLLAFSALFSGLTLGVMGLDTTSLAIIMESGEPVDRARAQRIMTVRKDGNLLLCTLLLGNVSVNSLMSILTAELTSGFIGFALSTILIVLAGEIIPQAACSRHGLSVGAKFVPVVRVLIVLFYPFSKPVALVLDWWLGDEVGTYFSRSELSTLVRLHASRHLLDAGEAAAMTGALSFRNKKVRTVMTPIDRVFAVLATDRLDYATIASIFRTGYSRVPVWANDRRDAIVGMLYAKDLMLVSPTAGIPVLAIVHFFARQRVNLVDDEDELGTVLRTFSTTRQQIAVVRAVEQHGEFDPTYRVCGIVTLEDVVEELLGREIEDEFDRDQRRLVSSAAATAAAERAEREQAALDTMNLVLHLPPAPGRGVNNALSAAEVRSIAAHLLRVLPAFRHSRDGTERFSYGTIGALVSSSSVLHFIALLPEAAAREEVMQAEAVALRASTEAVIASSSTPVAHTLLREEGTHECESEDGFQPVPDNASSIAIAPSSATAYEQVSGALLRARPLARRDSATPIFLEDPTFPRLASGAIHAAAVLVARGEPSDRCLLILHGRVRCVCGNDGVTADKGPWDIIAERSLGFLDAGSPNGPRSPTSAPSEGVPVQRILPPFHYVPDFSAFALTPSVRCLSITRADVERICLGIDASDTPLTGSAAINSPATAVHCQPPFDARITPLTRAGLPPRGSVAGETHTFTAATGIPLMDRVHLLTETDMSDIPDLRALVPTPTTRPNS